MSPGAFWNTMVTAAKVETLWDLGLRWLLWRMWDVDDFAAIRQEWTTMTNPQKIGILICDRYRTCAGGKCFRALKAREGAFRRYRDQEVEVVGFTSCDGCPGGNVEYSPEEMKKNGAETVHLATGLVVGYPPCPYIDHFSDFIRKRYAMEVVLGTHPIPQKYYLMHKAMRTWDLPEWTEKIRDVVEDEAVRLRYD
jgi:predicted metal-binding protein